MADAVKAFIFSKRDFDRKTHHQCHSKAGECSLIWEKDNVRLSAYFSHGEGNPTTNR